MGPDVTQGTSGQRQPRPKGRCFGSAVLRRPCPPQPCSPEPRLARVSRRRKRGQQAVRTTSWPSENARDPGQTPYTRDVFAGRDVGRASSYPVSAGATSHPAPPPVSATEGERAPAGRRCLLVRFLPLKRVTVLRGTRRVQSASEDAPSGVTLPGSHLDSCVCGSSVTPITCSPGHLTESHCPRRVPRLLVSLRWPHHRRPGDEPREDEAPRGQSLACPQYLQLL